MCWWCRLFVDVLVMSVMEPIQQITAHSADLPPPTPPAHNLVWCPLPSGHSRRSGSHCSVWNYCQYLSYQVTKITIFPFLYCISLCLPLLSIYYMLFFFLFYSFLLCCCVNFEFPPQGISRGTIYYLNLSCLRIQCKLYHRKKPWYNMHYYFYNYTEQGWFPD